MAAGLTRASRGINKNTYTKERRTSLDFQSQFMSFCTQPGQPFVPACFPASSVESFDETQKAYYTHVEFLRRRNLIPTHTESLGITKDFLAAMSFDKMTGRTFEKVHWGDLHGGTVVIPMAPLEELLTASASEIDALRKHGSTFTASESFGMDQDLVGFTEVQKQLLLDAVSFTRERIAAADGNIVDVIAICKGGANRSGLMLGFVKKALLGLDVLPESDLAMPENILYRAALTNSEGLKVDPDTIKASARMRKGKKKIRPS